MATQLGANIEGNCISRIAGEAFTSVNYRLVKVDSTENQVVTADAEEVTVGISQNNPASGGTLKVQIYGVSKLTLGSGGASAGDFLNSDADGQGVTESTTNKWASAIALEDGDEDDVISVLIIHTYISSS